MAEPAGNELTEGARALSNEPLNDAKTHCIHDKTAVCGGELLEKMEKILPHFMTFLGHTAVKGNGGFEIQLPLNRQILGQV